jgi:hypothetical protein
MLRKLVALEIIFEIFRRESAPIDHTPLYYASSACAAFRFAFATRNIVTLFGRIVVSGTSGAGVGGMAGNPLAGAAGAAFNQVAGVTGNDVPEFRLTFRRCAFDLARRLNRDLRNIPSMPELLGSILARAETAAQGPA